MREAECHAGNEAEEKEPTLHSSKKAERPLYPMTGIHLTPAAETAGAPEEIVEEAAEHYESFMIAKESDPRAKNQLLCLFKDSPMARKLQTGWTTQSKQKK